MTELYRYGIIGTGISNHREGATGFGMAHTHWPAFKATGRVELVAISDIDEGHARYFQREQSVEPRWYRDYQEMLAKERLDVVSICTWPHLHAEMTVAAAQAGVRAIHCEKPMATTWGDCVRMKAAADGAGAHLTFNHQRRHLDCFQRARRIAQEEIAPLITMECQIANMFDWGTHWLDMLFFYNDDQPAEWVIGQIDSRTRTRAFGADMENMAISHFKWRNGVRAFVVTGFDSNIRAAHRLVGEGGVLEANEGPLRVKARGDAEWRVVEAPSPPRGEHLRTAADVVRQLDQPGYKSILSAGYAIQSTEVIFATYLSSRLRGRVDLPLTYEGNALQDMLAAGEVGPERRL